MIFLKTTELQPELQDLLRSLDMEYQYAYTADDGDNKAQTLAIQVECVGVSLSDLETLLPWGHFVVCPVNHETLELYTSLPADIEKCIIK